ncbi:PhaM family polyhydroxyalkanoate granule multifunctional regulatory protein [Undibacterium sp. Ji49W]|uniref:PhaM family polyhydroxyalkanoate granule multifunctional regulatory protein n=1 Tax=Undibacterium sp. Ji49W TaxID=3413040 RepID=UPI003BF34BC1
MSNPFSGTEIPGMNAMGDTLSFVKRLWGSMQVPGMVAPPMSLDELDKKIQDLKTVESWLTVNMNMLRGTIQTLEVQRATIAALQSLGESFAQHAQQTGAMAEQATASFSAAGNPPAPTTASTSNADWPMHPAAAKEPEPDLDEEADEEVDDMPPETVTTAARQEAEPEEKLEHAADKKVTQSDASAQFANPAAWWGLLQEQFKQAVSKALEGEPTDIKADAAPPAATVSKPRSAGKTTKEKTATTATRASKAAPASKAKSAGKAVIKAVAKSAKPAKPTTKPGVASKSTGKTASKTGPAKSGK